MNKRSGFTLFELLVVLAILGLLFALLLPAVQKVRQAAARTQSANNLKQYALACHNYHDTFASFPPGVDGNGFSAFAHLLPFVEQDNVYKQIDFNKPMTDPANEAAAQLIMKICINPQDPIPNVRKDRGATNYLFSAGTKPTLENNDGVFFQSSKIGLAQITDGTSNTFMIAETLKGDGGDKAVDVGRQYVLLKNKDALKDLKDESGVRIGRTIRTSPAIVAPVGWTGASCKAPSPARAASTTKSRMSVVITRAASPDFAP